MFRNLFKPDSGLMIFMTQVTDCIFLSMFFLLGCVPVFTVGASLASMYDAVYRGFRKGEKNTWQRFFHAFRLNWKVGILPTLLFGLACICLVFGMIRSWNAAVRGQVGWEMFAAMAVVAVLLVGILSILFPMLSRFENSFLALWRNTAMLAMANLPRTLLLGILNTLTVFLCIRFIYPLFFLPALAALIGSFLIEPMFKPYMPPEPEENEAFEEEAAE